MTETIPIDELNEVLRPTGEPLETKEEVVDELEELIGVEEEKRELENKVEKRDEALLRRLKQAEDIIADIRRILKG